MPDGRIMIGAAFRGVPFYVEESDRTGGRRASVHEFPLRDDQHVDDMGRRARSFRVRGYVIGDGYIQQRDRLIEALEDTEGPGQLIHPYYGKKVGICTNLSVRESIRDGGMAIFDLEFVETPAQSPAANAEADFQEQVADAAAAANAAVDAQFQSAYSVDDSPSFAIASLADEVKQRANELRAKLGPLAATSAELAQLDTEIKVLVGAATTIVRTPSTLLSQFTTAIGNLADTAESQPRKMFSAILDVYRLSPIADAIGTSNTRVQERANQDALTGALRRIFLVESARLLSTVEHETLEDALADRADLLTLIDEQLGIAGDGDYPALMALRATVVSAVPGGRALARVITIERPAALPSLLVAYQLYGSVEKEGDIIARNSVQHPGFLPSPLEVLSNG